MLLELKNVCKDYGKFALKDVSFALPEGYIMGLIGPNGAGKTTTIGIILNLVAKDSGAVNVFGMDHIRAEVDIKRRTGVVFDSSVFVEDWRLADAGKAMGIFYDNWDQDNFRGMLERFSLDPRKKVKELSRGMQTKLMLACAFSHDARLLILDEPTSGMDPIARDELLDLLREYIQDGSRGVLFSTHITADLERAADFITYIRGGKIFYTGGTDELMENYAVIKGGEEDLTAELREKIHGLRITRTGFDGLIRHEDFTRIPAGCVVEKGSIDDIVIYTAREELK